MLMAFSVISLFSGIVIWSYFWSNRLIKEIEKMGKAIEDRRLDFLEPNIGVANDYIVWMVARNLLPAFLGIIVWVVAWCLVIHPIFIGIK